MYGGASVLLLLNIFFMGEAIFRGNFVPIVPILAGILTTAGLLIIVYVEHRARLEDKRDHRRISRVANQLESPLRSLQEDIASVAAAAEAMPGEARLALKRMETKSKVVLENIRDVFLTLQAQEGKLSQEVRTYDLCELVQEAIRRLQPLASARNVELSGKNYCQDAAVKVDKRLFLIALAHIIENGILYTLRPGKVNLSVTRGVKSARVMIQDRGVGIKEEELFTVFQPFARGTGATQFDPDGIGIGLTVSKLIIQEFGGRLTWQQRESSTGTEFEITLPLVRV